jgi:Flp pilus assembly protein TadG
MTMRALRTFVDDEGGAALVETAIMAPFLVLLCAGVFEFSNILHTRLMMEEGAKDAARYVARCSELESTCEARGQNIAVTASYDGTGSARVTGATVDEVEVLINHDVSATNVDDGTQLYRSNTTDVPRVFVTWTHAYTGTGLWAFLGFGEVTLVAEQQERVIGW